ncbi:phosphoribosyltransferase [Nonomuraea rhodomycinica]|uniref:Phosphoribosyltransferase n=1 Tax=Nonomuraea rhodomycinica TaxID=1712872 RepID=A0A7Y6IQN0_9ACTN|nr:phosphoribosyltransferase [Nonomuraea rhodomycinica]NUW41304.1 phosphoribosyltransferase [Nonomuraea rhodomycinica]
MVPVSLCARTGDDRRLYDLVTRRRTPPGEPSPATLLAATLARFHRAHLRCLTRAAGGPFTLVTTVPGAGADRPVEAFDLLPRVVQWVSALRGRHRPVLMPGGDRAAEAALTRHIPDERAFHVLGRLDGERVLLLDELFVTGARVQSAASALYRAGAEEVVALVVARLADPWADTRLADAWARPYDFGRCCLCDPAARPSPDAGPRAGPG